VTKVVVVRIGSGRDEYVVENRTNAEIIAKSFAEDWKQRGFKVDGSVETSFWVRDEQQYDRVNICIA